MHRYILAVDQGTTSSKAIILDEEAHIVAASDPFPVQSREPRRGWVEYEPWEMLESIIGAIRSVLSNSGIDPERIAGIGLANQGETVIAFDTDSGDPVYPAISWLDKRGRRYAEDLEKSGHGESIFNRTGLRLDPYFSAFKMHWILNNIDEARSLSGTGRLCIATSDTWLLWQLLETKRRLTDAATASRTMLFDLETCKWDDDLLELFGIPKDCLPEVVDADEVIGHLESSVCSANISVGGLCVDQHAAVFGQRCLNPGEVKATYGTGCFVHENIGDQSDRRVEGLLTSLGWRIGSTATYVLDGGIFVAGRAVEWLAGCLRIDPSLDEVDSTIDSFSTPDRLADAPFFIPALSGLAAPYWNPQLSASWSGLTTATGRGELVYSVLESIAFRVRDVIGVMRGARLEMRTVRVDGGMTSSNAFVQLQANVLGLPIDVFKGREATAYGVGLMAGIAHSVWSIDSLPSKEMEYRRIAPNSASRDALDERYERWSALIERHIGMTT